MHAHHTRHTHAHHAHTHDSMYIHVYTCTHCGRKGNLAYDRIHILNFPSKHVWVRKGANPYRPKKVWVPKSTPIAFDVGVCSHTT